MDPGCSTRSSASFASLCGHVRVLVHSYIRSEVPDDRRIMPLASYLHGVGGWAEALEVSCACPSYEI